MFVFLVSHFSLYLRDAMLALYGSVSVCLSVCLSVSLSACLPQVGVLPKYSDRSSWFFDKEAFIDLSYRVVKKIVHPKL